MNNRIPGPEFDAELGLVRHLVSEPPWVRSESKGLRAAFRRWTSADLEPSLEMLAPLWRRIPAVGWKGLNDPSTVRSVHHAAFVLHLLALGLDPGGKQSFNLGKAAKDARVGDGRFARLMNTPFPSRMEALGRLFRRFRSEGIYLRIAAPRPDEDEFDCRSRRWTARDPRRDDLAAMQMFLFTNDPKIAVARWAAGYFRSETSTERTEAPTEAN